MIMSLIVRIDSAALIKCWRKLESRISEKCVTAPSKPHDAFSVGEVFNAKDEELPDFIGNNGYFSSMFDFNETIFGGSEKGWYDCKEITPDD